MARVCEKRQPAEKQCFSSLEGRVHADRSCLRVVETFGVGIANAVKDPSSWMPLSGGSSPSRRLAGPLDHLLVDRSGFPTYESLRPKITDSSHPHVRRRFSTFIKKYPRGPDQ
eukprot:758710-Amphidinium_carterae.1